MASDDTIGGSGYWQLRAENRELRTRLATLEAERKHMVALIETIKIEYPSMARELELDDLPTQEESTK